MRKAVFALLLLLLSVAPFVPAIALADLVSGLDWTVVGTGDLYGDSNREILLRNERTGEVVAWQTNMSAVVGKQKMEDAPGRDWKIVGIGDFNGDGRPDILLRNTFTDLVAVWYLNGLTVIGEDTVATADNLWQPIGVGDFNKDGSPDILWRNSVTGEVVVWYLRGKDRLGTDIVAALPFPWNIVGVADFDVDGSPGIFWENSMSGEVLALNMNGAMLHFDSIAPRSPPWTPRCWFDFNGDVHPEVTWKHIITLSKSPPQLFSDLPTSQTASGLRIRAPPFSPDFS